MKAATRRFIAIAFAMVVLTGLLCVDITLNAADAETYKEEYDISVNTYRKSSASEYNRIYRAVQTNSKEVMLDAARDSCRYDEGGVLIGPNHDTRPFACRNAGGGY